MTVKGERRNPRSGAGAPVEGADVESGERAAEETRPFSTADAADLDAEEMRLLGRIKVDLDSPLEKAFTATMWLGIGVGLVCIQEGTFGTRNRPASPFLWALMPYSFATALIAWALRRCTDNYYLLDVRQRRVLYHFRFIGWEKVETAFGFDEIQKLDMLIVTVRSKSTTFEEHRLRIHLRSGSVIDFSDTERERAALEIRGRRLANLFGHSLIITDLSVGADSPAMSGAKVWFHVGQMPITEHRLAVFLGMVFLVFFGVFVALLLNH